MSENKNLAARTDIVTDDILMWIHQLYSRHGVNLTGPIRQTVEARVRNALTTSYNEGYAAGLENGAGKPSNVFTVAAYLGQRTQYFSDSKGVMLPIVTMPRQHAANAAEKMIRDAQKWADQAGNITKTPAVWITGHELYKALVARSQYGS